MKPWLGVFVLCLLYMGSSKCSPYQKGSYWYSKQHSFPRSPYRPRSPNHDHLPRSPYPRQPAPPASLPRPPPPPASVPRPPRPPTPPSPPSITPVLLQNAFQQAEDGIRMRSNIMRRTRPPQPPPAPASRLQFFQASDPRSQRLDTLQERFEEATAILATELQMTPEEIGPRLSQIDLRKALPGNATQTCQSELNVTTCRLADRYRTIDGTCNNLQNPSWGSASSCFRRLVRPNYADGIARKRVATSGNPLPAPRRITLEIHSQYDRPSNELSHMFMVWGQFLDHDISLTPQSRDVDSEILNCCPVSEGANANCDPILLERDDPFYQQFNITCLSNVRSARCATCTLGLREQINQITAYIDASQIYGLDSNQIRNLRNNDGTGTMRFVNNPQGGELSPGSSAPNDDEGTMRFINNPQGGELPPESLAPNDDECSFQDPNFNCFETGDQRANQHPALTSLHTMFLREHNRIARRLKEINPSWDEETLFQEARRIVGAEMQMITYNEYLPLVIGDPLMEDYRLDVQPKDDSTRYNSATDASLVNEFSTAAFRFGHSMINSFFQDNRSRNRGYYLKDMFNFPFGLYSGQVDGVVEGLMESPSQMSDRYIVRDVTNHLYQARGSESGLDLAALNINRGRDHGVPGYTTLVQFCRGPQLRKWSDLDKRFHKRLSYLFRKLYERVEDIDLFSGGLAEKAVKGGVVGPTFACIIATQFQRLKYGDRFYFEHRGETGSFTPDQLNEIKKVTLGKIICDNTGIRATPEKAFLFKSFHNPMESCRTKLEMDLTVWKS